MKLLNKSIGLHIIYATVLLLITIPVLYFAIQHRVLHEMDENLAEQKNKILDRLEKADEASLLPWLQNIQPDVKLIPLNDMSKEAERFYTITSYDKISEENTPYRIMESVIRLRNKPYQLQIKNSLLDTNDLIESIVKIVAILLLLIITGMVLINQLLSKKLWKPFYKTINKLNDYKIENNQAIQFEKTNIAEFTHLNKTITALTSRNKEVYQSQKEFTENAAHELQTPLAIFQGKLDLLMQTNPLDKEQSELIGDLSDINQRMKRLHKTLLLLTKIENNQFAETEKISIKQVTEKLIDQYSFKTEQKGISIEHSFTNDIEINANKILIEILIENLLSNAVRHNSKDGHIEISITEMELTIINSSNGVALNKEKLFHRFQKQTTDNSSLGLGLQIAQKIAENYQYRIDYTFESGVHHFKVIFKIYK